MKALWGIIFWLVSSGIALCADAPAPQTEGKVVELKAQVVGQALDAAASVAAAAEPVKDAVVTAQIVDKQLPNAPEWFIYLLNRFPILALLVSFYFGMLGIFRGAAELLLWYSATTAGTGDDKVAQQVEGWAEKLALPLSKLGWGTPTKLAAKQVNKAQNTDPPKAA